MTRFTKMHLAVPWAIAVTFVTPAAGLEDGTRLVSGRYAFRATAGGAESLVVLSDDGSAAREISLDRYSLVSVAGRVALLGRDVTGAGRELRLLGDDGSAVAAFFVPADRNVVPSDRGVALIMNDDHAIGHPMVIDFVNATGRAVGHYEDPDVTLLDLAGSTDGRFVAQAVARNGWGYVYAFDAVGALTWRVRGGRNTLAGVALTPSGGRTAVLVPGEEPDAARLLLVDRRGRALFDGTTRPFSHALFSPDESLLVLAGDMGLQVRSSRDGALLHDIDRGLLMPSGASVAFGADGTQLFLVARSWDAEGQPLAARLLVLSRTQDFSEVRSMTLDDFDASASIIALGETAGGVRVTTATGVQLVRTAQ